MSKKRTSAAKQTSHTSPHFYIGIEVSGRVSDQTLPSERSSDAYVHWFFEFLRTDLGKLTPGQRLGMRSDLYAFVDPELIDPVENETWEGGLPSAQVLEEYQRDANEGFKQVRQGGWYLLERGITYGINRLGHRIIRGHKKGTFKDQFRAAAMEVIMANWDRLLSCPHCGAAFVKTGKRKYCSAICASRAHWDAFKVRRKARDHHQEYVGRVRKRLAPKVKVKARRRT